MTKMKFKILAAVLMFGSMLTSCKSQYEALLNGNDVDAKYEAAFDYFNHGKYSKAAQLFENMSILTTNTERDDTVQYYWGLCNYRYKDYYTAETNFSKFIMTYPYSPFFEEASFLRIDCLYRSTYRWELDQTPTYNAIKTISEYIIENPKSTHVPICKKMLDELNERLDTKAFENAKLYYKMEKYKSAVTAFKNILKDDADNIYREDILYYIAKSSFKYAQLSIESKQKERYLSFIDDYYFFIGEVEESPYRHEMDVLFHRAQKALGRYTGSEEDLMEKEKDFERERKKLMKQTD